MQLLFGGKWLLNFGPQLEVAFAKLSDIQTRTLIGAFIEPHSTFERCLLSAFESQPFGFDHDRNSIEQLKWDWPN